MTFLNRARIRHGLMGAALASVLLVSPLDAAESKDLKTLAVDLERVTKSQDLYEKLEFLEPTLKQLNTHMTAHPKDMSALFLRAKVNYWLALTQDQRGAQAIDYWAYVSEVVDPLRYQSIKDLKAVVASSAKDLHPEANYYLAQVYAYSDQEEELIQAAYQKACQLKYKPACKEIKK